jgi:hypothetical protein
MSLILRPPQHPRRRQGTPRHNGAELVATTVAGQVANPLVRGTPYRIGRDGVLRVVPGTGGICLNRRVGDRAVGLAGDHVEPGAAIRNNDRESVGGRSAPNRGLLVNACVGDLARVVSGPARGAAGVVTGKHGGIDHVLVDFAPPVLRRLQIGDRIQVQAVGQGMRLPEHPAVACLNLSPALLGRWGLRSHGRHLHVPCTHLIPAGLMGSGLGRPDAVLGDVDIQLSDAALRRRLRLDSLRLGDLVAICGLDARFGPSHDGRTVTVGVVVHSDSMVAGHGPGVTPLLVGGESSLRPVFDPGANLAVILGLRSSVAPLPAPGPAERRVWGALPCAGVLSHPRHRIVRAQATPPVW